MSPPALRRPYSAPAPVDTTSTTALKDSALPKIPTLSELIAIHTRKEAEKPAAIRVFGTPELLDEVLKKPTPREAFGTQRVGKLFFKAVKHNSKIEKRFFRMVGPTDSRGQLIPHIGWNAVDRDEVDWECAKCPTGLVPWDEIVGAAWNPEHPSPEQSSVRYYSLIAGSVFDSFFFETRTPCEDPFCDLPSELWRFLCRTAPSGQLRNCYLHLQTLIEDRSYHVCAKHPQVPLGLYHEAHVWADLEPSKPEAWSTAISEIMSDGPYTDDVWKYADLDTSENTKYLRQSKCFYTTATEQALVDHVLYQ